MSGEPTHPPTRLTVDEGRVAVGVEDQDVQQVAEGHLRVQLERVVAGHLTAGRGGTSEHQLNFSWRKRTNLTPWLELRTDGIVFCTGLLPLDTEGSPAARCRKRACCWLNSRVQQSNCGLFSELEVVHGPFHFKVGGVLKPALKGRAPLRECCSLHDWRAIWGEPILRQNKEFVGSQFEATCGQHGARRRWTASKQRREQAGNVRTNDELINEFSFRTA